MTLLKTLIFLMPCLIGAITALTLYRSHLKYRGDGVLPPNIDEGFGITYSFVFANILSFLHVYLCYRYVQWQNLEILSQAFEACLYQAPFWLLALEASIVTTLTIAKRRAKHKFA